MAKGVHDERYRRLIDRLVALRKVAGLVQGDLASRLGKPQQYVSRYELGERRLDVFEFIDIATALNADPLELLRESL